MSDDVLRILLIEDNAGDVRLLREMFSKEPADSFKITHVLRMKDGVDHLASGETDIVLLDMGLPDEHGLASVRRAKAAAPDVPVIVLTGLDDENLAAEAMRAGAEDYLIKGQIESRALPRALRHAIERRRMQAEADAIRGQQIQMKEEFLSHVSHELRSPLTAIHQFVTILVDGLAGELSVPQQESLGIVLKNVQQLRTMIDDLLEINRVQMGKLIIELQSTSVTDAITYTMNTLAGSAAQKRITLSSNMECRLPLVHADPSRLRQVLVALLDNAIKFTPVDGTVSVGASLQEDNASVVTIEVADSGMGIRPDLTELIFSRQFQADPALEGRRGLGLGLYICKELVTRQGGHVWARNLPGKGAIFTVTVPIVSLRDLIAPLLLKEVISTDSLGLISVETGSESGWRSDEARAEWSHESRALIQKCLLRTSDMLLPKNDSGGATEMSFVVVFGGDGGAKVVVERIRSHFRELEVVQRLGLTVSVSYHRVRPTPTNDPASPEESVRAAAASIAGLINAESYTRIVHQ
jgi:signal transduction histidine kinase